jgi:hypothetical protein
LRSEETESGKKKFDLSEEGIERGERDIPPLRPKDGGGMKK